MAERNVGVVLAAIGELGVGGASGQQNIDLTEMTTSWLTARRRGPSTYVGHNGGNGILHRVLWSLRRARVDRKSCLVEPSSQTLSTLA